MFITLSVSIHCVCFVKALKFYFPCVSYNWIINALIFSPLVIFLFVDFTFFNIICILIFHWNHSLWLYPLKQWSKNDICPDVLFDHYYCFAGQCSPVSFWYRFATAYYVHRYIYIYLWYTCPKMSYFKKILSEMLCPLWVYDYSCTPLSVRHSGGFQGC